VTRAKWEPPIAFERLQAMIEALGAKRPLSAAMRAEIADALDCFYVSLLVERDERTPGRGTSDDIWLAAAIVRDLVDAGATVKAAVAVVSPRLELNDRIERAYRKLRAGDGPGDIRVNPDLVAKYVSRLAGGNK
jgi:hypothetical protein